MGYLVRSQVRRVLSSATVGIGLLLLTNARTARAAAGDIPEVQARAQRGSIRQQIELGAAYFTGRGVEQSDRLAAYWYEKAANAGDPYAQKQIGFFYQAGIGVPRDPVRAVKWFQRAAAGGLASAKTDLGVAYVWGIGVPKDPEMVAQLFREALAKGDGSGGFSLGDMYYFGVGVEKNPATARHWYELGARLHDPLAEFRLGSMIAQDHPQPRKLKRAAELLRASAAGGYVPAKHRLGVLLIDHPELSRSADEALVVLGDAANAGTWQASVLLGILARDGTGRPADPAAAYFHFRVAALQGGRTRPGCLRMI
jgi:hypothetical protein